MKIDGGVTLDVRFASEAAAAASTMASNATAAGTAGTHAATPARLNPVATQVPTLVADRPALPSWKTMVWRLSQGLSAIPTPTRGYAPEPALVQLPTSTEKAVSAKVTVTSPLDFLRDSRLTAEEKLVLLLAQQQKDVEKEIDTVLKKAEAKSAQKQKSSGGGGPAGLVSSVIRSIPGVGVFDAMGLSKLVDDVAKMSGKAISELSGPILAAGATALGMPHLAPLAMTYGPKIVEAALEADGGAEPKVTNAPNAGTGSSNALDPVETQRLTLLVNRQQQWSGTVSNLLHSIHQTRMSVIQNLR